MAILGLKPEGIVCRLYSVFGLVWLQVHNFLRLPIQLMPIRRLRAVHKLWSKKMQKEYISSVAKVLPFDEPCELTPDYNPKVTTDPKYTLTQHKIEDFYTNGYLKLEQVFDPSVIEKFGKTLLERRDQPNKIYGYVNDRDHHLELPEMMDLMKHPAIVECAAQLLGPDLMVWRSQIFYKPAGGKAIGWHQASTYLFEEAFTKQLLVPPNLNELFMVTVWIPCDPVTEENGCLQFVKHSLLQGIKTMRLCQGAGFSAVSFSPNVEVDNNNVHNVEMNRGDVLIFSERTIHGSPPNKTKNRRLAFNYRVTPTNVKVYPHPTEQHRRFHKATQMNEKYDLTKWKTVVIRGKDNHLNRT